MFIEHVLTSAIVNITLFFKHHTTKLKIARSLVIGTENLVIGILKIPSCWHQGNSDSKIIIKY